MVTATDRTLAGDETNFLRAIWSIGTTPKTSRQICLISSDIAVAAELIRSKGNDTPRRCTRSAKAKSVEEYEVR